MTEPHEQRLKRMRMRATHRGTKEMDIILGRFAAQSLEALAPRALDLLEALMEENDQDLYLWVTGQARPPARFSDLVDRIARDSGAV